MDVNEVQPAGLSRKSSGLHSQKLLPHFHQQCKFVTRWMSFPSSKLFIFCDCVIITNFILKTHEIHFSNLSETLKKQNEIRYRGQTQGTQSYRELLSCPCRRAEREVGWRRCLHSWPKGLDQNLLPASCLRLPPLFQPRIFASVPRKQCYHPGFQNQGSTWADSPADPPVKRRRLPDRKVTFSIGPAS